MAQQGQADTGVLRHLGSGGFIAAPAEKVDDAQAPWLAQGLEHGGALRHGNGCRCSDWHGIKYTRLGAVAQIVKQVLDCSAGAPYLDFLL